MSVPLTRAATSSTGLTGDKNSTITASVTSSTHKCKPKTYMVLKKDRIIPNHNVPVENVPVLITLKDFAVNFMEAIKAGIFTQHEVSEHIGARVKVGSGRNKPGFGSHSRRNNFEEGLDSLGNIIIAQVPIDGLEFYPKAKRAVLFDPSIPMPVSANGMTVGMNRAIAVGDAVFLGHSKRRGVQPGE